MGLFNNISTIRQAYKILKAGKNPRLVKTGLDLNDEDRQKAEEIKTINYQKKKIMKQLEVEKEKIKGELEIRKLQAELEELQEDLGDYDEDDDEQPQNQSIEQMFMSNIFKAMNNNKQSSQETQGSFYPTGTTGQNSTSFSMSDEPSPIPDEEILKFLGFMNKEQIQFLSNLPKSTIIRAHELLKNNSQ